MLLSFKFQRPFLYSNWGISIVNLRIAIWILKMITIIRSEILALWFAHQKLILRPLPLYMTLHKPLLCFITFKMRIKISFLPTHRICGSRTERIFVKLDYKLSSTCELQGFSLGKAASKSLRSPVLFLAQSCSNNARLPFAFWVLTFYLPQLCVKNGDSIIYLLELV